MTRLRSIPLLALATLLVLGALAPSVRAASTALSVTPVIIDEKVNPRDILNESISITNTTEHKLELYPSVNDVQPTDGEQPFQFANTAPQAANSLSNWIELSRGVIDLDPGEEKTLPFVIRVPNDAPVGSYHADISLSSGATRDSATAAGSLADVTVNAEVQADIKELLQLNTFSSDNIVFAGDDVLFKYQVENTGNQPLTPKGEVRIYNRRGEEVASVNVNNEGKTISPDQMSQLASVWSAANGFGEYKAVLDVDYGTNQPASVQDVTYFWIIPWLQLLVVAVISLVGLILFALYFERWFEGRHFSKLAAAGLLRLEAATSRASSAPVMPFTPPAPRPSSPAPVEADGSGLFDRFAPKKKPIPEFRPNNAPRSGLRERMEASAPARPAVATSGTIDLKQMIRSEPENRVTEHHVINLKS